MILRGTVYQAAVDRIVSSGGREGGGEYKKRAGGLIEVIKRKILGVKICIHRGEWTCV